MQKQNLKKVENFRKAFMWFGQFSSAWKANEHFFVSTMVIDEQWHLQEGSKASVFL